jgi:hypothetical protein
MGMHYFTMRPWDAPLFMTVPGHFIGFDDHFSQCDEKLTSLNREHPLYNPCPSYDLIMQNWRRTMDPSLEPV